MSSNCSIIKELVIVRSQYINRGLELFRHAESWDAMKYTVIYFSIACRNDSWKDN